MAEIKNYTLNFVSGRPASRKLAFNEIERVTQCCREKI